MNLSRTARYGTVSQCHRPYTWVAMQNRWLIGVGSIFGVPLGLTLAIFSSERALSFVREYGSALGLGMLAVCMIGLYIISRQK